MVVDFTSNRSDFIEFDVERGSSIEIGESEKLISTTSFGAISSKGGRLRDIDSHSRVAGRAAETPKVQWVRVQGV